MRVVEEGKARHVDRWLTVAVAGALALGAVVFVGHNASFIWRISSADFAVNRAAARLLEARHHLYSSRVDAGFVGPPSTALLFVPWAHGGYSSALRSFRVMEGLLFVATIAVVGEVVPRERRLFAWLVGLAGLLWFFPVVSALGNGQPDALVALLLALGLWASVRGRWGLAGAALGVASVLKISPWLVLLYFAFRAGRAAPRVVVGAASACFVLVASSAVVEGRVGDWWIWLRDIVPGLAHGSRSVENQSLPAFLSRLFGAGNDLVDTTVGLGALRFVGYALGVGATLGLWWLCRRRAYAPLEVALVVVVALLAGPLSWAHYASWALVALIVLADGIAASPSRSRAIASACVLGVGTVFMALPLKYPSADLVAAHWYYRPYSGAQTLGLLAYALVGIVLLAPTVVTAPAQPTTADGSTEARFDFSHTGVGLSGAPGQIAVPTGDSVVPDAGFEASVAP